MCGIGARFSIVQPGGWNLLDLHLLLQYGIIVEQEEEKSVGSSITVSNNSVDDVDSEEDDGRNETYEQKLEKIKAITLQSSASSSSNNSGDDESVGTDNNASSSSSNMISNIKSVISPRGPDATHHEIINFGESNSVTLIASILALRGDKPYPQPITMTDQLSGEHTIIWNGEIFGNEYFRECVVEHGNDTVCLLDHLVKCENEDQVLNTLANIEGPFSFVYVNKRENYILFSRDILGRRSLLYCVNGQDLIISSVACHIPGFSQWRSIGVNGVFKLSLPTNNSESMSESGTTLNRPQHTVLSMISWEEIYKRTGKQPLISDRVMIEPKSSGGEDENEPLTTVSDELFESVVDEFITHLSHSVQKRVTNVYSSSNDDERNTTTKISVLFSGGIDSVIITALAHLNLEKGMPIDLLNVSFGVDKKQQDQSADRKQAIEAYEELRVLYPDRLFRLVLVDVNPTELAENQKRIEKLIYPQNTVIDFNIGSALWFASRGRGYIYKNSSSSTEPNNTLNASSYTSTGRVILCGIGSDEQLGGYKRHFKKYKYKGWRGLNEEMDMDIKRLWIRNLGRDDRVISDHGRESRNPFLDEPFINFVRKQPLWYLADFTSSSTTTPTTSPASSQATTCSSLPGDKKILRRAAQKLGLTRSCMYVKRAMQFGSNVAKISHKKQHASTVLPIEY